MGFSQKEASKEFGVNASTPCQLLKDRKKIVDVGQDHRKERKMGKSLVVESVMLKLLNDNGDKQVPVSGNCLKQQAENFCKKLGEKSLQATNGWFLRFKKRNCIVFKKTHGEASEADEKGKNQ